MENEVTVLDGGLTTVLETKGYSLSNDPLWSARLLYTHPSEILDVHKRYLESGSDIITTASYQASTSGFQKHLCTTFEESVQLIKLSVDLAKQAKEEYLKDPCSDKRRKILIAGSIGPYGAALADGSEYTGDYCDKLSHEELIEWHRPRLQYLVDAGADIIAFETIPAAKEGEALLKLLNDFPHVKAWLSFSCQSPHTTAHGEDIKSVAKKCAKIASASQLVAIGVNCCPPQYVVSLLNDISSEIGNFPLIAYPNSGETWLSKVGWVSGKGKPIDDYVDSWLNTSARFIGGCCRMGPEDIAAIARKIKNK